MKTVNFHHLDRKRVILRVTQEFALTLPVTNFLKNSEEFRKKHVKKLAFMTSRPHPTNFKIHHKIVDATRHLKIMGQQRTIFAN